MARLLPVVARFAFWLLAAVAAWSQDFPFQVSQPAEVVAELEMRSPLSDWSAPGREAAVGMVFLDGRPQQSVMLYAGAERYRYSVFLGRVETGPHRLRIERDRKLSATGSGLEVAGVRFAEFRPGDPMYPVIANAPILYAREDTVGRFSDVPMLVYAERMAETGLLEYTIVYSNEDGGTSTRALMARWGRTTDIDYGYRAWLDANGRFLRATIQAKDHKELEFQGQREGSHPVLVVATDNNMVSDDGTSAVRYQIAPILVDLSSHSREQVMDEHPLTYRVMAQELAREAKLRPFGAVDGERISDPRNYLYVEARLLNRQTGVSVLVRRRGDGVWRSSDLGRLNLAVSRDGWVRTTVELPPGTSAKDLSEIAFACLVMPDEKFNFPQSNPCRVEAVSKVFFLGRDYAPGPSAWSLAAPLVIPAGEVRAFPLGR